MRGIASSAGLKNRVATGCLRDDRARRARMTAGNGALVPERRDEIVPLALRALVSGTMASCLTGAVIGLLPVV